MCPNSIGKINIDFKLQIHIIGNALEHVTNPDDLYQFCVKDELGLNKWTCSICYEFNHQGRQRVRNHVESKHYPNTFKYSCDKCDKICNTKKALEVHNSEKHRQLKLNL